VFASRQSKKNVQKDINDIMYDIRAVSADLDKLQQEYIRSISRVWAAFQE
jgi:hypothetical protein